MCVYACRHEEFQVCHSSLLNLGVFFVACADAAWWSHVREFRDACHVCEKFVEFLPWIRVSLSNLKESVFTHQIERERGRSQREAKWKSGSQRDLHALINSQSIDSKCFPRTEDNRTRHQREMEKKMERARERETFLSVLSSPVQSCLTGTAVSFSYHRAPGLQPRMCRSPLPSSSHCSHLVLLSFVLFVCFKL